MLGQLRVRGFGVDIAKSPTDMLAQVGPRLAWLWTLGDHVVVVTRGDAVLAFSRPSVTLNQIEMWRVPRYVLSLGIDLGVRFP